MGRDSPVLGTGGMGSCARVSTEVGPGRSVWSQAGGIPIPLLHVPCRRYGLGNLGTGPGAQTFQITQEEMAKTLFSLVCSALCCSSSGRSTAGAHPTPRGSQSCGDTVLQPPCGFGHETFLCVLWIQCALCVSALPVTRGFAWLLLFLLNPQSFVDSRAWNNLG